MGQNKCPLCDYIGREDNLKRHVARVHNNPSKKTTNDPKYACRCGKKFTAASSLKRHKANCGKIVDSSFKDSVDESFTLDEIVKVEYLVTLRDGSTRKVSASVESLLSNPNIQMTVGRFIRIFRKKYFAEYLFSQDNNHLLLQTDDLQNEPTPPEITGKHAFFGTEEHLLLVEGKIDRNRISYIF